LTRLVLLNISTDTNRIYLFPCPIHYTLKRLDMIVPHERVRDIAEILHKHKVGGLTMYDTMGRGLTRQEPLSVGRFDVEGAYDIGTKQTGDPAL
jgi:hypothetical protein